VYYDILGREVQRRESAPNNKTLVVASSYNDKGQLYHKSLPGFGAPSTEGVTYTYDSFGRLIRKVSPTEVLTYKYTGKTVEETNTLTGKSVVVESNEMGLPITTTTVQGTTTFSYNAFGAYKSISAGNIITTFGYDKAGNKVMVSNPNTGNASTTYNAWGQPLSTTDANGNHTSFTYDLAGRIITLSQPEGNVSYTYDTKVKGAISSIAKSGHVQTFSYDLAKYGRLISLSENVDGQTFTRTLSYDDANHGRIKGMTYPNGFSISYAYDSQGFLSEILTAANKRIWARGNQTPLGQPINVSLGNGTSQQYTYDSQHNLTGITVAHNGTVHLNQKYSFSSATGNLTYREDALRGLRETFTYDNMDRLTHITGPSGLGQQVSYSPNGNINFKSDAGTYSYNAQQPNAVSQVSGSPVETNYLNTVLTQSITYNSLNKPTQISAGTNTLTLSYGVNQQRVKEQRYVSGGLKETRYLLGSYELIKKPGQPDEHHCYVISPNGPVAVNISTGTSAGTLSYIHTDYLGSIALITNSQGAKHEELSYDAWGNRRSPATWQPTPGVGSATLSRGYTFHQHYDYLGLINMNGRMYDPLLGRMLNADPIVANPMGVQSHNAYSYVLNNPLRYTDPSGYRYISVAQMIDEAMGITPEHGGGVFSYSNGTMDTNSSFVWDSNGLVYGINNNYTIGSPLAGYYVGVTSKCPVHRARTHYRIHTVRWRLSKEGHNARAISIGIYDSSGKSLVSTDIFTETYNRTIGINAINSAANGGDVQYAGYTPPPKSLPGFPGAERIRPKGGRPRWKLPDGDIGEWDGQHGDLERYNPRGKHKGSWNPEDGKQTKPPVPGRTIDPYWSPSFPSFTTEQIITGGLIIGGAAIIIFDIVTFPSGEGLIGVEMIRQAVH